MSFKLKSNLILFHHYFGGRRLTLSTQQHCSAKDWNATKQRPKNNPTLTVLLDRFESRVKECHLQLRAQFYVVTPDSLRAAIQRDIQTGGRRETFIEYIKRNLDESKSVQNNAYKIFKVYPGSKDYQDITPVWLSAFQQSMEADEYSANYIALTISIIKGWLNKAAQEGLHRNVSYKTFTMGTSDNDAIYLTQEELSSIRQAELTPAQSKVRDRFLISCFTGLRFSDNISLTTDSIQGGFIHNRNKKTGAIVVIPIHPVVQEIIDRHLNGLPKSVSNVQANVVLKKIGKVAGIETPVEITKFVGGKAVRSTLPKYELICTHCGRRSFSSNAILAGIPSAAVRKITGHSTESSFNKYVRISQLENAEALQNHSFFNK